MGNDILEYQDNRNRPTSFYENTTSEISYTSSSPNTNIKDDSNSDRIPSQMDCLTTTVPQNIATLNIAGKHTPTRNSLRHSRMIVLNKTGNVPLQYPAVVTYYKFIKSLLWFITFLGTILCTLSILLLLWSPNIRARDNTYWSAIPVILSGIVGLLYLCFVPKQHYINKLSSCTMCLKILSTLMSLTAAVACLLIFVFAVIHWIALTTMTCAPPDKVNTSCVCELKNYTNDHMSTYHYTDLSCSDVNNMFYIIIIPTCITNAVTNVCELLFLYFQWCKKTSHIYTKVPVNNNSDTTNIN